MNKSTLLINSTSYKIFLLVYLLLDCVEELKKFGFEKKGQETLAKLRSKRRLG